MNNYNVVTQKEWLAARKNLLVKEKEFSRLRDELTSTRQAMPWEKVDKEYRFHGLDGEETLADLFNGLNQLIIYHFMFDPEWNEGCKSCSFVADHYAPTIVHLAHRDVTLVTVSRAPLEKLEAFKQRMDWDFKWVSSLGSDFNHDFDVTFTQKEIEQSTASYNYREGVSFPVTEAPGISVFYKDPNGTVYHTYSAYSRGLENFIGAYTLLDIVPKGRDEDSLAYGMEWLRHKDRYDDPSFVDPYK